MGYNKRPEDFAQIDKVVDMYEELGVDRIATWTYRGGYGTVVAASDALELWDNIGRNYKTARENNIKTVSILSGGYLCEKKDKLMLLDCSDIFIDNCVPYGDAAQIAKKYNKRVILNPAPIDIISDVVAENTYIVTPNEQEKKAINVKKLKSCITTLGKKGCLINEKNTISAIPVKAVDTTGAGDTFNGVLAVCVAEGMDLEKACRYAVTASGISIGREYVLGAIPYRKEIEEKL